MVKKSSKGKEKKLARKAATERAAALAAQLRRLTEASACGAALAADYPAFQCYERKGLAAELRFYSAAELPPGVLDWALALTRSHMAALYEACPGWGWSEAKKRAELAHPAARYLLAYERPPAAAAAKGASSVEPVTEAAAIAAAAPKREAGADTAAAAAEAGAVPGAAQAAQAAQAAVPPSGGQENFAAAGNGSGSGQVQQLGPQQQQEPQQPRQPVAFVHYRFEEEEGQAVLYCYEIQVAQAVQGKGLGKFLMQLLELVGRRSGVARLMLTVFHENKGAVGLYRKLGYVLDDDSPGAVDPAGDHKYEIMTKWLQAQQQ